MGDRTNNEILKETTARILSHFWECSPAPTYMTESTVTQLFPELTADELKVYLTTITWLEEEDYIRTMMVDSTFPGMKLHVKRRGDSVLTEKGYAFLETPSSMEGEKTPGQRVFEAIRDSAKDIAA